MNRPAVVSALVSITAPPLAQLILPLPQRRPPSIQVPFPRPEDQTPHQIAADAEGDHELDEEQNHKRLPRHAYFLPAASASTIIALAAASKSAARTLK